MAFKADEALARFRQCFDDAGLQYDIVDMSTDNVKLRLTCNDISLSVWFDVQQQQWGFDLLQGGSKSCAEFEAFEDFLGTYLNINTVLIPEAKRVTDAFEREFGISTVYEKFTGNKQEGYTVRFRVLSGEDQHILVRKVTEGYQVRLVVMDGDSSKYKVKAEYKYELSDDGAVTEIPTMHSFVKHLLERYDRDNTVQIQRVGDDLFNFEIEGLPITAQVQFNYLEVRYHVIKVNSLEADLTLAPSDSCDLSAIYMACKDFYDDHSVGTSEEEVTDGAEESADFQSPDETGEAQFENDEFSGGSLASEDVDAEDQFKDSDKYGVGCENASFESVSEPVETEESDDAAVEAKRMETIDKGIKEALQKAYEEPEQPAGIQGVGVELTQTNSSMNVESIKRILEDGEVVGVQFIIDGQPHIFTKADALEAGFPLKRVKDSVNVVYKCGLRMTEDELKMRKYAEEAEHPVDALKQIIDVIFA